MKQETIYTLMLQPPALSSYQLDVFSKRAMALVLLHFLLLVPGCVLPFCFVLSHLENILCSV